MEIDKEVINSIKITPLIDTLKLEKISDDEYFSEKYSNYISNSRLGKLKKEGADAFFKNEKSPYNPSFEFGTLIHQQVLEPNEFEVIPDVFKPSAKAGLMADELYNPNGNIPSDDEIKAASYKIGYYKDKLTINRILEFRSKAEPYWRDRYLYEQKNPIKKDSKQRIYSSESNYNLLVSCLKSLEENKNIQDLLHPTGLTEDPYISNETAILMDIEMAFPDKEPEIFKLKAKLDNFSIDKEEGIITVNDLKTTSRPASIFDPNYYSYQREIASYSWLLKLCAKKFFGLDKPQMKGNFLVVSTVPDYSSLVVPMTPKLFKQGFEEYKFLLKTVKYLIDERGYSFNI